MARHKTVEETLLEQTLADVLREHRRGLTWLAQAKFVIKGLKARGMEIVETEDAGS